MTSEENKYLDYLGQRLTEATLAYARSNSRDDYNKMMDWQNNVWRFAQEIAEQEKQNLS